jgi:hypothetical protein
MARKAQKVVAFHVSTLTGRERVNERGAQLFLAETSQSRPRPAGKKQVAGSEKSLCPCMRGGLGGHVERRRAEGIKERLTECSPPRATPHSTMHCRQAVGGRLQRSHWSVPIEGGLGGQGGVSEGGGG